MTNTLMREIDKLVIGKLATIEDLAIYSNCAKTLPLNILVTSFATVLIPYIMKSVSSKKYQIASNILKKYLSIGYMTVWMFSFALLICAPEAIQFFYSGEYIKGLPIFVVYIIDGMIQFASFHLVVAANGNSKYLMNMSIGLMVFNLLGSFLMYFVCSLFGYAIIGPALTTLLCSMVYVCMLGYKSKKILNVSLNQFFDFRKAALYFITLAFIGLFFVLFKYMMYKLGFSWLFVLVFVCTVYCSVVFIIYLKKYIKLLKEINDYKKMK